MRAFLFDIDGTLVDSSASIERVWRQVAREFGVDEAEVLSKCHGRRDADVVEEFFKPEVREAVVARVNVLDTEFVNGAVPTLGAPQLLATLADGQWAAVTSGPRPLMAARLRAAVRYGWTRLGAAPGSTARRLAGRRPLRLGPRRCLLRGKHVQPRHRRQQKLGV